MFNSFLGENAQPARVSKFFMYLCHRGEKTFKCVFLLLTIKDCSKVVSAEAISIASCLTGAEKSLYHIN